MPDLCDRHGLALSTRSPRAVEQYVQGLDQQLSLNAGGVEGLTAAVEADPEFALGYAGLAFAQWYRQDIREEREIGTPRCGHRHVMFDAGGGQESGERCA